MILYSQEETNTKQRELEVRVLSLQKLLEAFGRMFERVSGEETAALHRHVGDAGLLLDKLYETSEYKDAFITLVRKIEQELDNARNLCAILYIRCSMTELREKAIQTLAQGDMVRFDSLGDLIGELFRKGEHEEAIRILLETKEALKMGTPAECGEALVKIGITPPAATPPQRRLLRFGDL